MTLGHYKSNAAEVGLAGGQKPAVRMGKGAVVSQVRGFPSPAALFSISGPTGRQRLKDGDLSE